MITDMSEDAPYRVQISGPEFSVASQADWDTSIDEPSHTARALSAALHMATYYLVSPSLILAKVVVDYLEFELSQSNSVCGMLDAERSFCDAARNLIAAYEAKHRHQSEDNHLVEDAS